MYYFFVFLGSGFAHIFDQIVSMRVETVGNTNFVASSHIKREKALLLVGVRHSTTLLLKFPYDGMRHVFVTLVTDIKASL